MTSWDPGLYLLFGDERTRPSADLVARIALDAPATAIDLGCGPGNSTQVLRERWPGAHVTGLDSSPEMITAARASYPDHEWMLGDIADWTPHVPYDLVFSNAALQWAHGHRMLVARLLEQVARGGALAFQLPAAAYSPIRRCIQEIAGDPRWSARMGAAHAALTMEEPHVYYDVLAPRASSVDVWETTYHHVMGSPSAIVDWISSTGLRPYLEALDTPEERERFLKLLTERVAEAYPKRADGRVLFPFRRTFVIAYR